MQLRITNFCVRGFYQAFLANASISPIAEPSAIPILVVPRIKTHCFLPLPSARLPALNLKKRGAIQPRTGSFQQRWKVGSTVRPQVSNRGSGRESSLLALQL